MRWSKRSSTTNDDDDLSDLGLVFFAILFVVSLFSAIILSVSLSIAHIRTRAWQKAKASQSSSSPELKPLVVDEDEDLSDSELEDIRAEVAGKHEDFNLTTAQKFRKEFGRALKGQGAKDLKEKADRERRKGEREERKKLAREVVREMRRAERRGKGKDD